MKSLKITHFVISITKKRREREGGAESKRFVGKAASSSGSETITNCRNAYISGDGNANGQRRYKLNSWTLARHLTPLYLHLCLLLFLSIRFRLFLSSNNGPH